MLVQERYWHGKGGDAFCSFPVRNSHPDIPGPSAEAFS